MAMPVDVGFLFVVVGNDLNAAMRDAAGCEELVGHALKLVAAPVHDDDFEASMRVEVHVERGAHPISELVLKLRELFGELAHVMVVDEGERGYGVRAARHLRPNDLAPDEVPQELGPGDPAVCHDDVEVVEQILFHRDAKAYERVRHGA
jgi:hypothetical protein